MNLSKHRLSSVTFQRPILLHQTYEMVMFVSGAGWLMCDEIPGWVWIRQHNGANFLDVAATWVSMSDIETTSPYEYPDETVPHEDWLYPERYTV